MIDTAYLLYTDDYGDCVFHAIFTSKVLLDEYISTYRLNTEDGSWCYEELRVNPADGEGL